MFHTPDTDTLRLCSVLTSTAFGLVFAVVRFEQGVERHFLHWSASALMYAAVLVAFPFSYHHLVFKGLLLGALVVTNLLLLSGLRAFDGNPAFRWWMLAPVIGCMVAHVVPTLMGASAADVHTRTQIVDTVTVAISALIAGFSFLASGRGSKSRGRRIVGLAMTAYLPGYAVTLASYVWSGSQINYLALIPTLSDQLLLAVLNLGLLAIPAERAQQRLKDAALRDPLTGAWNRGGFDQQSRALIAQGAAVLAIDLDDFKRINDEYGHLSGDSVLVALAVSASAEVEALDGVFARIGGDEFLAILPARRAAHAQACANRIREACRKSGEMPQWSMSIGLSEVKEGETDLRAAVQRADQALYRAKVESRDGNVVAAHRPVRDTRRKTGPASALIQTY